MFRRVGQLAIRNEIKGRGTPSAHSFHIGPGKEGHFLKRLLLLLLVIIVVLSCAVPAFAVDETEAEGGGSINNLQPIGLPNSFKEQIAVWYDFFRFKAAPLVLCLWLVWTGITFLAPAFFPGQAAQRLADSLRGFYWALTAFVIILYLPTMLGGIRNIISGHGWTPRTGIE